MRKYSIFSFIATLAFLFASCSNYLDFPQPGSTEVDDYFTDEATAIASVTAAYVPLQWELNNGAYYYCEWFIGDIASDDALKGGQNLGDMTTVYDIENFKTTSDNLTLLEFYRTQYQGIFRSNLVLDAVPAMSNDLFKPRVKERVLAEAKFLRALYYFRLVRIFGGVPKVDFLIKSQSQWKQARASVTDIYELIYSDLIDANLHLWKKNEYPETDWGRATKGAAQALLMKAYPYNKDYQNAKNWGDSIINSGEYQLCPEYKDNFTLEGENGIESVFEIQYMFDPNSSYTPDPHAGNNGIAVCAVFGASVVAQDNFNAGSNYYFFVLDEDTYMTVPRAKIAADYRVNETERVLYIWPEAPQSYSAVNPVGLNWNGNEGYISLKVEAPQGWSGFGLFCLSPNTTDFRSVTRDYTFHIALKSAATNTHAVRLYADNESSSATAAIGSSNFVDAGKTYVPVGDFARDNRWHVVEIPMSKFFDAGLEYHEAAPGNYFALLSGSATGTIISLDALFIYKKGSGQGINGTTIDELDVFVTQNTVNVIGATQPIEIYNIAGVKVFSTTESVFGTEELGAGVYIVKSGNAVAKIIVKQ